MNIYIYPGCFTGQVLALLTKTLHGPQIGKPTHVVVENLFMASYGIRSLMQERMPCLTGPQDIVLMDSARVETVPAESTCVDINTLMVIGVRQNLHDWLVEACDFFALKAGPPAKV